MTYFSLWICAPYETFNIYERNDPMCVCFMFVMYVILSPFSLLNKSVQKFVIFSLYDLKIPGFLCGQVNCYGPCGIIIKSACMAYLLFKPSRPFTHSFAFHGLFGLYSKCIH